MGAPSTLIEGYRLAVTSFLCQPWSNRALFFETCAVLLFKLGLQDMGMTCSLFIRYM